MTKFKHSKVYILSSFEFENELVMIYDAWIDFVKHNFQYFQNNRKITGVFRASFNFIIASSFLLKNNT